MAEKVVGLISCLLCAVPFLIIGIFEKNSKEKKDYLTSKDGLRFAQYVDSQEVFTQLCSKKEMYRELKK